jgi:hypothetical protein
MASKGRVLKAIPATIAVPPPTWRSPAGSPNTAMPASAPMSGSRLRNAPATSAETFFCP